VEEPEEVADPKSHDNDDDDIEYRLYGRLHGDEAVHNPKHHAHRNEGENNIRKWQRMLLSMDRSE
jgi:hypothetical protein